MLQNTRGVHFAVRQANRRPVSQLNTTVDNELGCTVRIQTNRTIAISVTEIDRNYVTGDDVQILIWLSALTVCKGSTSVIITAAHPGAGLDQ